MDPFITLEAPKSWQLPFSSSTAWRTHNLSPRLRLFPSTAATVLGGHQRYWHLQTIVVSIATGLSLGILTLPFNLSPWPLQSWGVNCNWCCTFTNSLTYYKISAVFYDPFMLSKPALPGNGLNVSKFGCQCKVEPWPSLDHRVCVRAETQTVTSHPQSRV